jgi:hypothetical protein
MGEDGGIAVSRDRGRTFRFVANLPLGQYYHVAVDDERPFNVYGGLQDNGSWRGPSSAWQRGGIRNHQWVNVGGGDGFDVRPHPKDPQVGYSLWQGGNLMRFDLGTGITKGIKPPEPPGVKLRFNWNAALAVDPLEPDAVYLGSQFVHRSTDRGESWSTISPDLTSNKPEWQKQDETGGLTPDVTAAENQTTLVAIAPSPVQKGVIWAGSDDGRIHVTRDGGATWTSVEQGVRGVPADTWVPHIEPSRHDAGTAFVVFDNHRRSDFTPYVHKTGDYGRTFTSLATPSLRGYALVIEQDPVKPELLFLGTEFGLYASLDGGRGWTHLKRTLPTASVMDLAVHPRDGDLVIATHGRALFVLDDLSPLRELSEAALAEPLRLFGIQDAQQHWRRRDVGGGFGLGAGEFRGENRDYGALITYSLNLPGLPLADAEKERTRKEKERQQKRAKGGEASKPEAKEEGPKVKIEVADAAGLVVRTFKGPATLGINRMAWDLPRCVGEPPCRRRPRGRGAPGKFPGTYTVTVARRPEAAGGPRCRSPPDERGGRRQRLETLRGGARMTARSMRCRIRRLRSDVRPSNRSKCGGRGETDKRAGRAVMVGDGTSEGSPHGRREAPWRRRRSRGSWRAPTRSRRSRSPAATSTRPGTLPAPPTWSTSPGRRPSWTRSWPTTASSSRVRSRPTAGRRRPRGWGCSRRPAEGSRGWRSHRPAPRAPGRTGCSRA